VRLSTSSNHSLFIQENTDVLRSSVTMTEEEEAEQKAVYAGKLHVEGQFEYNNLEVAREAAEIACNAVAKMKPSRSKTIDDDWTEHLDRSD
jgi:hypothetical protein